MKRKYLLTSLALAIMLKACIYIPTPQHTIMEGRGMVEAEDIQDFKTGTTTREEVLLRLGEPDFTLNEQSIFAYSWTRVQGYFFIGGGYSGAGGPVGKTTLLMLEFDSMNLLKRFEFVPEGVFKTKMETALKWTSGENH